MKHLTQNLYIFTKDARHFQILAQSSLLALLVLWSDFAPNLEIIALTIVTALITQAAFMLFIQYKTSLRATIGSAAIQSPPSRAQVDCRVANAPRNDGYSIFKMDLRSPLISALSLCLLFRAGEIWFFPLAAIIAISSKFLIRYEGKHLFNPSNIAIVALLLLFPQYVWVSPGQWGADLLLVFALICLAFLALFRVHKRDVVLFFISSYAALVLIRALWLGDPLDIPAHQLQNGALLVFTFFMMSDPKTTPDHIFGRLIFALSIAAIGFIMHYQFQVREGLFYALALVCMITPLIDRYLPAQKFQWRTT